VLSLCYSNDKSPKPVICELALEDGHKRLQIFIERYRICVFAAGNVANWVLVYFGENFELKKNFGSYLLTVLLTNLVLYFVFYIMMKLICREKVYSEPLMYIVIGTILWGCSGVFFFSRMTSWTVRICTMAVCILQGEKMGCAVQAVMVGRDLVGEHITDGIPCTGMPNRLTPCAKNLSFKKMMEN